MEFSNQIPATHNDTSTVQRTLKIDWSFRKFRSCLTDPAQGHEPLYIVKSNPFSFDVKFFAGPVALQVANMPDSDSDTETISSRTAINKDGESIGKGTIHPIKIDCTCSVNNQSIRISAARRLVTHYNYPSTTFSSAPGQRDTMTWKTETSKKWYDMVLLDGADTEIARFKCKYLGLHNAGAIELLTTKAAQDPVAMNEIVVTCLTLYGCMLYRSSNPAPFVGALLARKGKDFHVTNNHNTPLPGARAGPHAEPAYELMDKHDHGYVKEFEIA